MCGESALIFKLQKSQRATNFAVPNPKFALKEWF